MDDQRVYFSGINNNIIKLDDIDNNKDNVKKIDDSKDKGKVWFILFLVTIIILVIIIIIFIIIYVTQRKHKKDAERIAKISFIIDNEENSQKNLLTND